MWRNSTSYVNALSSWPSLQVFFVSPHCTFLSEHCKKNVNSTTKLSLKRNLTMSLKKFCFFYLFHEPRSSTAIFPFPLNIELHGKPFCFVLKIVSFWTEDVSTAFSCKGLTSANRLSDSTFVICRPLICANWIYIVWECSYFLTCLWTVKFLLALDPSILYILAPLNPLKAS